MRRPRVVHERGALPIHSRPRPLTASARRWRFLASHRGPLQLAIDALAWVVAFEIATAMRFEFDLGAWPQSRVLAMAGTAVVVQMVIGHLRGLYNGRWQFGSFEEVAIVGQVVLATTLVGAVVNRLILQPRLVPVSVTLVAGGVALIGMVTARYVWRLVIDRRRRPDADHHESVRVLVFGAGNAGSQVIDSMLNDRESRYVPVGLLDDDTAKARLRIRGVRVMGDREALATVAAEVSAHHVVVAVPSAGPALLRELSKRAIDADVAVSVLPPVSELLDGRVGVADIRPLSEADLLGRHVVETDVMQIAGYIKGKRVLVTGAGGSIGSELCRQLHRYAPDELVMLDRDESALHAVQLSIEGRALLDTPNLVVANIRERDRVCEVFEIHRPQVVFHAAALKHLPLLEMHPDEGMKTNVWGTKHMLDAAVEFGVEHFVNVSTDKAADPSSVLGHTKRIAERLTAAVGATADGKYLSVRFGNVLGSRGSVLETFQRQIADGGPVTVTSREVTRFFMTVQEAVQLVIQAGAIGGDGQALVLDMGEPVRIADVARRLVAESPRHIEIVYTGLRPGEKSDEVLFGTAEKPQRSSHPLIMSVEVPALSDGELARLTVEELGSHG